VSRRLLRTALAAALTAVVLGCGGKSTSDATVTACNADPDGGPPRAEGQIINNSSKDSVFFVRVGFYDTAGNRVSEGSDSIGDVEPGTSSPFQINGAARAKGPLTCKVLNVRRSVSP
jgi:hypothetical protein